MTLRYRILGQSNPAANTPTVAYTVPANTSSVISTIQVANIANTAGSIRISVAVAGAAASNAQYIAYNTTVLGYDALSLSLGLTLANTDTMTVYANTGNMAFNIFGSEIY